VCGTELLSFLDWRSPPRLVDLCPKFHTGHAGTSGVAAGLPPAEPPATTYYFFHTLVSHRAYLPAAALGCKSSGLWLVLASLYYTRTGLTAEECLALFILRFRYRRRSCHANDNSGGLRIPALRRT